MIVAGVESGGTKFVAAVGSGPGPLMPTRREFRTTSEPAEVLGEVADWLREQDRRFGPIAALGIASFGPLDLEPNSPTYGRITRTPKPGWSGADVLGALREALPGVPSAIDTDVNGAAVGERRWGAAQGIDDLIYVTIGTGIGAGVVVNGRTVKGLIHPEAGHLKLKREPGDDFAGMCPFHGDCWEGLCSGPAMLARTDTPANDLPADSEAWGLFARYTGQALLNLSLVTSPRRLVLGGGMAKGGRLGRERLFGMIRDEVRRAANGYIASPLFGERIGEYIVPPGLGDDAGVCGAMAMAFGQIQSGGRT